MAMGKFHDIGLRNRNIGKFCIAITLLCFCIMGLFSQADNSSSLAVYDIDTVEVKTICSDYLSKYSWNDSRKWNKYVLFVDYQHTDSLNTYTVTECDMVNNLHLKKPDAYMYVQDTLYVQDILIFIYTKDYEQKKDTTWYKQVLNAMLDYFGWIEERELVINKILSNSDRRYLFSTETGVLIGNGYHKIILYQTKNRTILRTKEVFELLYEYEKYDYLSPPPPTRSD